MEKAGHATPGGGTGKYPAPDPDIRSSTASAPVNPIATRRTSGASGSTPNAPPNTATAAPATPAVPRTGPNRTFQRIAPEGTAWKKAADTGSVPRKATAAARTASFAHHAQRVFHPPFPSFSSTGLPQFAMRKNVAPYDSRNDGETISVGDTT